MKGVPFVNGRYTKWVLFLSNMVPYINIADTDILITGGGHPAIRGMPGLNKKMFRPFGPQFGLKIRGGGGPGSPSPFPISATDERVKKLDLEVEPPRIKVTLSTRPSPEKNAS